MGRERVLVGECIRLVLQCKRALCYVCLFGSPKENNGGARIETCTFECSCQLIRLLWMGSELRRILAFVVGGIEWKDFHERLPSTGPYAIYFAMNVQGTGGNLPSRTRRTFLTFRRRTCPSA